MEYNRSASSVFNPEKQPLELSRAVFHMIAATSAMLYFYLSDLTGAIVLLVIGTVFSVADIFRSRSDFVRSIIPDFVLKMVREKEKDRISAITHFIMAATIIDFLYLFANLPKDAVLAATMFVAFGDPMARLLGIKYGKKRIGSTSKTYVGSGSFLVFGIVAALIAGVTLGSETTLLSLMVGGLVIAVIEVFSRDWDNFAIPLFGSLVFWFLHLTGL